VVACGVSPALHNKAPLSSIVGGPREKNGAVFGLTVYKSPKIVERAFYSVKVCSTLRGAELSAPDQLWQDVARCL